MVRIKEIPTSSMTPWMDGHDLVFAQDNDLVRMDPNQTIVVGPPHRYGVLVVLHLNQGPLVRVS